MREAVLQRCGHFRIVKHVNRFREAELGGDDQASVLVELADSPYRRTNASISSISRPSPGKGHAARTAIVESLLTNPQTERRCVTR